MRNVIVSNMVSLDGFMAGENGEIDWFAKIADKEFENYGVELIRTVDTMMFGRVTYQLMESYWPSATTATDDQRIIDAMNSCAKVVFSKTLEKVDWRNSRLVKGDVAEEVSKLKTFPGKDMVIYGSGSIVSALAERGLIDDYRLFVVPVVLGRGKPLFRSLDSRIRLNLVETRTFPTGVILLRYGPDKKGKVE